MIPKPKRVVDRRYLKFVRVGGCVLCPDEKDTKIGASCMGPVDAHHVIPIGGGIMGSKVSDYRAVGLCRIHHQMAHDYPSSTREHLEAAITRLNKEYWREHPVAPREASRKRKPYTKKTLLRAWAIFTDAGLTLPIFEEYADALQWRATTQQKGKIVRCQIRIEGKR